MADARKLSTILMVTGALCVLVALGLWASVLM